ncbi:urea carboxylase-associated family protein [Asticcacaulis sp. SL142]|uniref:urea amidolyase associated protein UAAP1 n=1 Tax=Asticcacaulis sp. SL142 TaxID=2995155 RepID=UPI00226CC703|nr:urea amidolyase associated protein UAAP1 [Asticcacaulis sp. SL142]WAC48274.1 urea carboxylase-associated family protein [Asticcacaulis sp. SL142]
MTTADPRGARDHARAQASIRVDAMPILPAAADDAPEGTRVCWEETVASGGYSAKRVSRGTRVRLIDIHGDGCASMLIFNAEMPTERLNIADTLKVQWNGYITQGKLLLSDLGRVMASVMADTAATHDAFCGASNQASNARKYGEGANHGDHPNARDRLMLGVAKFGLSRKDIHPCINWFKGVTIEADGTTSPRIGPFSSGREVILRAEMDLIIVIANAPHVLDPRDGYTVTPIRLTAWSGAITPADDEIRTSTPEGLRAFLNTEDFYAR